MKFTAAIAVSILAQTVYGLSGTLHYHKSFSDVTEFYNEVNVDPSGQPYNSYFRANGFNGGYLGIQHNATAGPRGKRVVFSVSGGDGDTKTTEEYCGKLSRCSAQGNGMFTTYEFPWNVARSYATLVRARPLANGYTEISGYFRNEKREWYHLATYNRKTNSPYLNDLYASVENPAFTQRNLNRKAAYGNTWIRNSGRKEEELTVVDLTHSNLVQGDRYGAGAKGTTFYLFVNGQRDDIPANPTITRTAVGVHPDFDMNVYS